MARWRTGGEAVKAIDAVLARVLAVALVLTACGAGTPSPCTPADRAAIGARYVASIEAACDRAKPLAACEAFPRIHAQYETERAAWVTCQR